MPDQNKESEPGSFFDDFGPIHELWIRLERGMQIMLGVVLMAMLVYCFTLLYISTIDVMQSLVAATGVDPLM